MYQLHILRPMYLVLVLLTFSVRSCNCTMITVCAELALIIFFLHSTTGNDEHDYALIKQQHVTGSAHAW